MELGVLGDLAPVAEDDRVEPQRLLDRRRDQLRLGGSAGAGRRGSRPGAGTGSPAGPGWCPGRPGRAPRACPGSGRRRAARRPRWSASAREARSFSRGSASSRRDSSTSTQYCRMPPSAAPIACCWSRSPPKPAKKSSTQGTNRSASELGTPMMVRKISVGSRIANSPTKSHPPFGAMSATRRSADLVGLRADPADRVGGEPAADQLPVLGVVGRVDLGRYEPVRRLRLPRGDGLAGEDLGVLVHLADLVVPGEDPVALRVGVEERRAGLPQLVGFQPVAACLQRRGRVQVDDRAPAGHPLGGFRLIAVGSVIVIGSSLLPRPRAWPRLKTEFGSVWR